MSGPRCARFPGDSPSEVGAPQPALSSSKGLAVFETWDYQARLASYSLIIKSEAMLGYQKVVKTTNSHKMRRKIELTPYSGILSV